MPVEIRELIIRATVVNNAAGGSGEVGEGSGGGDAATIAACVEQVLKILERRRER